jgi:hypothetical protein
MDATRKVKRRGLLRYNPCMAKKNPHAVALGRKGGKARAERLTPKELSDQGRKAVLARWKKREPQKKGP